MLLIYIFAIGCVIGFIKAILETMEQSKNMQAELTQPIAQDQSALDEITHLECLIERNKTISNYLELELERTSDLKKRSVILSKLNTLDNQTFRHAQKIDKLLKKLE